MSIISVLDDQSLWNTVGWNWIFFKFFNQSSPEWGLWSKEKNFKKHGFMPHLSIILRPYPCNRGVDQLKKDSTAKYMIIIYHMQKSTDFKRWQQMPSWICSALFNLMIFVFIFSIHMIFLLLVTAILGRRSSSSSLATRGAAHSSSNIAREAKLICEPNLEQQSWFSTVG